MIRRLSLATAFALLFILPYSIAAASEDTKTRPDKQEIIDQMTRIRPMSLQQRDARIDQILSDPSGSKTPRSDFMFCIGLAFLGNYKAQTCVGNAYEKGLGVVEDLSEAYVWYTIARENQIKKPTEEKAQALRDGVIIRLGSSYPAPSEEELEEQVKAQKARIAQYQAEVRKAKP